jgi:hypothetical protein
VIRVALVESFWFASLTLVVLTARTIEMCITVDWPLRSHRTFLVLWRVRVGARKPGACCVSFVSFSRLCAPRSAMCYVLFESGCRPVDFFSPQGIGLLVCWPGCLWTANVRSPVMGFGFFVCEFARCSSSARSLYHLTGGSAREHRHGGMVFVFCGI